MVKQLGIKEGEKWETDLEGDKIVYSRKKEEKV
jgi:antitoxin component of MazEF toxin-antitoxin module